jgi:pyruvate,water dikinase
MKIIHWFSELMKNDIPRVGGKGANLGEMVNSGFPIPPGFCVSVDAYSSFIKANKIDRLIKELDKIDVSDTSALDAASAMIKGAILAASVSEEIRNEIVNAYEQLCSTVGREVYVAVRSSATAEDLPEASFAGQQASFLNVKGADTLVHAVKECWASLFEPRAIFYRVENKFNHMKVKLSVVVQSMIQSEKAGIGFTVDPLGQDPTNIVIEAVFGLGEAAVSGAVTPDRYVLHKHTLKILDKKISKQEWMITKINDKTGKAVIKKEYQTLQKLADPQIIELGRIMRNIELHYGFPQDIEWAVESDKIYIVQSRPITTLNKDNIERAKKEINEMRKARGMESEEEPVEKEFKLKEARESKVEKHHKGKERVEETKHRKDEMKDEIAEKIVIEKDVEEEMIDMSKTAKATIGVSSAIAEEPAIPVSEAHVLVKGLAASPGFATNKVIVVMSAKEIGRVKSGDILVTTMTTPDFVPAMRKASAIVTDEGGMTAHAAIVSRELGIPCIVGTGDATKRLEEGDTVTVDATRGIVYEGKVDIAFGKSEAKAGGAAESPVTATKIYVNVAEPEVAEKVAKLPCDGVGLLRAEFMIANIGMHPRVIIERGEEQEFIDKLAEGIARIAGAFYPRPVVYRTTDFKSNEYRNLPGGEKYEPIESNPMIGYRGCSRYTKEPDVFSLEMRAIKKVRDEMLLKNVWVMLPFVRKTSEVTAIKALMEKEGLVRSKDFKLWLMAEVPSMVVLIDEFCKLGIDGVSIGSNDLTQLTLGIDRDSSVMASEFDERDEAVMGAIKQIIDGCRRNGVTVSLCGQSPSVYPEIAEKLVEFGITSISVNPDAIERTKRIVASAERKVMLEKLRSLDEKK